MGAYCELQNNGINRGLDIVTMSWSVYLLKCSDGSLYTGITTDVERRLHEHNHDDRKAARYTRSRRPSTLVYAERCDCRSTASKREADMKKLTRSQKLAMLDDSTNAVTACE